MCEKRGTCISRQQWYKSHNVLFLVSKQEAIYVATFDLIGTAKFCMNQEIVNVIAKPKEAYQLTIKIFVIHNGMNIVLW